MDEKFKRELAIAALIVLPVFLAAGILMAQDFGDGTFLNGLLVFAKVTLKGAAAAAVCLFVLGAFGKAAGGIGRKLK